MKQDKRFNSILSFSILHYSYVIYGIYELLNSIKHHFYSCLGDIANQQIDELLRNLSRDILLKGNFFSLSEKQFCSLTIKKLSQLCFNYVVQFQFLKIYSIGFNWINNISMNILIVSQNQTGIL